MEVPHEESDDGSSVQSDDKGEDDKTDQKDKPPPELMLDLQVCHDCNKLYSFES